MNKYLSDYFQIVQNQLEFPVNLNLLVPINSVQDWALMSRSFVHQHPGCVKIMLHFGSHVQETQVPKIEEGCVFLQQFLWCV